MTEGRIYLGGRIAYAKMDIVSALSHHPMSLWLDSPSYAGPLHAAPAGRYVILLGNGKKSKLLANGRGEIDLYQ